VRSFIVGTAGHIDHGKSALVRALTGIDPDRLKEEKERGITIDLGFAHLPLGDGHVVSLIDVPGHERFVRNMLAGAHGIDAVILVVAADESVMPQTREHFHICRLLEIPAGLIALTKCDLADAESQALAELEVRELVAGSFLERARVVRVSARTGAGLEELKEGLAGLAGAVSARASDGLLRLPVDRVFTLHGFGTVVTGTLVSGVVRVGDELEVLPSGKRTRVRGLQVHGAPAEGVEAGSRTAANLAGLEVADLARGDVLARPGTMLPTSMIDAHVSLLPGQRPLKDQARVRVHLASAEVLARVRVPGGGAIVASCPGVAQLRLERRAAAGHGDRLILRSYSPASTIGGGVVLDPLPFKHRSLDRTAREQVEALRGASPADAAALMIAAAGTRGVAAPTLAARVTLPMPVVVAQASSRSEVVAFGKDPVVFLSRKAVDELAQRLRGHLERFHRENPLKAAVPREELRRRLFSRAAPGVFEGLLESLVAAGELRLSEGGVALAGHSVALRPEEEAARQAILTAAQAGGLAGVEIAELAARSSAGAPLLQRVAQVLLASGILQRVGEKSLVHREHAEELKRRVRERWPAGTRLDVGEFKELTGLSRKFVIPLLEYLDRERVTRRSGNERYTVSSR